MRPGQGQESSQPKQRKGDQRGWNLSHSNKFLAKCWRQTLSPILQLRDVAPSGAELHAVKLDFPAPLSMDEDFVSHL